jgi:mRNA-degrading endonuclease RelE of RelBE toxin-antitoxin system
MGKEYQEKVKQAVRELEIDPIFSKNVSCLYGELKGLCRYRIGRFRMIFRVLPETKEIRILAIASRGNVYK